MTPLSMSPLKMSFIIIWKVARLWVKLKNMTRGSNKLLFIWKVVFPLISLFDPYVVIAPVDVQLGEILSLGLGYFIGDVWDQGEGVGILHSHHIELLVVLD